MEFNKNKILAEIIGRRFCVTSEAVLKWMEKRGYTYKDFGKIIQDTKNLEGWLAEVIWS